MLAWRRDHPPYGLSLIGQLLHRPHHDVTCAAFLELTLGEVPWTALLFAARSVSARLSGRPGLPSKLRESLLEQFSSQGFTILLDRPGEEMVVGILGQMWKLHGPVVRPADIEHFAAFDEPGFVKAVMSFAFAEEGHSTLVTTETRVQATDPAALAAFRRPLISDASTISREPHPRSNTRSSTPVSRPTDARRRLPGGGRQA